jgi:hypothetical protein
MCICVAGSGFGSGSDAAVGAAASPASLVGTLLESTGAALVVSVGYWHQLRSTHNRWLCHFGVLSCAVEKGRGCRGIRVAGHVR